MSATDIYVKVKSQGRTISGAKVFWLTGLSGAGKSTIAAKIEKELITLGIAVVVLDGDKVRQGLCSDLSFSADDRAENLRRISEIAALLIQSGIVVLCPVIAPLQSSRVYIRNKLGGAYKEIFVSCPLGICERRDVKGNYKKARLGLIRDYTGISSPYDVPIAPDLVVSTELESVGVTVEKVRNFVFKELKLKM